MPPKRAAADSVEVPVSSSDALVEEQVEEKSDDAPLRKPAAHPSTAIMVREALQELDSRKGASSRAIQSYIKEKYPSVDLVRLKHLVRRALKKGIETGTLVRPANSSAAPGATGKFRLPQKGKEPKTKSENTDPNVQKVTKAAKDDAKKAKTAGTTKKKETENEEAKEKKDAKPPKKSKKDGVAPASKPAPAKKPAAKKAAVKGDSEGTSDPAIKKSAKTTKGVTKTTKEAKAGKASQSKAAKAGSDASAPKATGKRGKKAVE